MGFGEGLALSAAVAETVTPVYGPPAHLQSLASSMSIGGLHVKSCPGVARRVRRRAGWPAAGATAGARRQARAHCQALIGNVPSGSEIVLGDAADPSFCVEAARGATTVYHCMNPPYDARIWADLIPRYMNNLIAASARTGARLVVLDNLYMLGRPRGRALNEDTPMEPCSRKGEIRARAAQHLFEAHRRGDVIATSGRASDFYGPGGRRRGWAIFSGPACWQARRRIHPSRWMRFTRITTFPMSPQG